MWIKVRDSRETWDRLLRYYIKPKRRRGNGRHGLTEPVEPDSPKTLSGGAAAALEFDD